MGLGCCTSVLVSTHHSVAICRQCYVTSGKRADLSQEILNDTHASSRFNARDVTSAAGPTITCTQSEDATVTPRSPNERMAVVSMTEVSATATRKRLAATSTLRMFPRPPNAFRRSFILVASGSEEKVGAMEVCGGPAGVVGMEVGAAVEAVGMRVWVAVEVAGMDVGVAVGVVWMRVGATVGPAIATPVGTAFAIPRSASLISPAI